MKSSNSFIYIMLAAVVAAWGLNVVGVKYLTAETPALLVAAVRMPLSGLALLPFMLSRFGWYRPSPRQWLLLVLAGVTSVFFHQLFLAAGVVSTTATNASLILGLNPLTTALLAAMFIGEKINMRLLLGIVAGFAGVVLAVLFGSAEALLSASGLGDLIMFLSMLAYVIGGLLVKTLSSTSMPTLVITTYSTLIGGVLLNAGAFMKYGASAYSNVHFDGAGWIVMLLSAWVASSLGSLGWNYAIKAIGANKTAMFINGMPFASMVGAVLFLGEHIRLIHALAFVLTTLGIVIGTGAAKGVSPFRPPSRSRQLER